MTRHLFPKTAICILILTLGLVSPSLGQETAQTSVFGGNGGANFSDTEFQSGARIMEVRVYSENWIDAVQLGYEIQGGRTVTGPRRGGPGGRENVFRLEKDEYITGISGRYGDYIDSLTIQTNRRTSPLFGGSGGKRDYRIEVPSGYQAVGFVGRSAKYLDAIGLITAPATRSQETQIFGGRGGSAFSDRNMPAGARISEIRVNSAEFIDGIQAVYTLRDSRMVEGPRHGGTGGRGDVFRLDSDEYVIGIYGRYGDYIDSMVIRTNKRTSQAFGGRGGRADYRIDVPQGSMAIGFAGRSAKYLDAIGLIYETLSNQGRNSMRRLPGRDR
jgi:hypothetical protein